ncbi:MAG: acyltransferase family protein [Planctomycetota bacterium]
MPDQASDTDLGETKTHDTVVTGLASEPAVRRHDLDALRALAMLLGIALHAAIAYTEYGWVDRNNDPSPALSTFFHAVHGFRMPLFFVLSGFFTAMLFQRRGLPALIKHRAKRIAIPLAIGLVTVVPLTWVGLVSTWTLNRPLDAATGPSEASPQDTPDEDSTLWTAAFTGDTDALARHLADGANVDAPDPAYNLPPLGFAALAGQPAAAAALLDAGADPNARSPDGNTALHTACFFGRAGVAEALLDAGADPAAVNGRGETPPDVMRHGKGITSFIANTIQVSIDFDEVEAGRDRIRAVLARPDTEDNPADKPETGPVDEAGRVAESSRPFVSLDLRAALFEWPVFHHLWFLWHLCWLVAAFAGVIAISSLLPKHRPSPPAWLGTPLGSLVWLLPMTAFAHWVMRLIAGNQGFGPALSAGLLPRPSVLWYYSVFFAAGAVFYAARGPALRVGRFGWLCLLTAAAVAPVAMGLSLNLDWIPPVLADRPALRNALAPIAESVYCWAAIFGLMAVTETLLAKPSPRIRYASDSSYWLYLTHLPLIFLAQTALTWVELEPVLEAAAMTVAVTAPLLLVYTIAVRHTPLGAMLNGKQTRRRPAKARPPRPTHAASSPIA